MNRLTSVTFPGSRIVGYGYSNVGNRATITYPGGGLQVTYGYDAANNLTSVTDWNSNQTQYGYDNAGQLTTVTLPSGTGIVGSHSYDNADRMTSISWVKGGSQTLASVAYALDSVGNRTQREDQLGTHSYGYDNLYRLTSVTYPGPTTDTYTYDAVGNRLTRNVIPYAYDAADRLLGTWGRQDFDYDSNGNTTRIVQDRLAWDAEDRLVQITPSQSALLDFSAGWFHNLAVKPDGTVWAWGANESGQLGDGTTTDRSTPAQVVGLTDVDRVAAGGHHSLALKNDGTVWAWGANESGQLGDGTTTNRTTPVQVIGLPLIFSELGPAIAAGGRHSVAIAALSNDIWAWGANAFGQVGDGTTTNRTTPVKVLTGGGLDPLVAAGDDHTLAFTANQLWGWGRNDHGQVGDGTTTNRRRPAKVKNVSGAPSRLSAGAAFSIADSSEKWTWGANESGQLGDGTTIQRDAPIRLQGLPTSALLSGGGSHVVAGRFGGLWGWGQNDQGR